MLKVAIILKDDGTYDMAYADSEVEVTVLRRGQDDNQIDKVESDLEPVE